MSPELKDLLTDAARAPRRVLDVEDIHRRGRRSRTTEVVAAVAGLALVLGGVAVAVDRLGTGTVDAPIVGDPDGGNASEAPTPDPTDVRTISAADMGADVLLSVDGDDGDGHVMVYGAGGSIDQLPIGTAEPSYVAMVADGEGGFSWQPDPERDRDLVPDGGGSPPVLHVTRDGAVNEVVPGTASQSERYRLVGGSGYQLLLEHRMGQGFSDSTADLVEVWARGSDNLPTVLAAGVAGWESGIGSAANAEVNLYTVYDAGAAPLIVDWPDRDRVVVWEGGEAAGGDRAMSVAIGGGTGYAVIDRADGGARLFAIDLHSDLPRVTDAWDVPLDLGGATGDVWPHEVSAFGDFVLVNRWVGAAPIAPIVYETTSGRWHVFDRDGRALLASPAPEVAEPAACAADDDLRNAPPGDGTELWLYATCTSDAEPWTVYRLPTGATRSGDVVADARQALDLMIAGVSSDQADRGYYASAPPGLAVRDVAFADGTLVVDFDFSGITMWAFTTTYGSSVWHTGLLANLLQLPGVEVLELRESGSCERYPGYFESEGCFRFRADEDAPWLEGHVFG